MPRMLTFHNGPNRYAVNGDRVAFVVAGEKLPKTRIFFSATEDDYIEVEETFDDVHTRISG